MYSLILSRCEDGVNNLYDVNYVYNFIKIVNLLSEKDGSYDYSEYKIYFIILIIPKQVKKLM